MGERIAFSSSELALDGYLAVPFDGSGPAVVVIQECWGLVPHIENVVDRFGKEGFLTIAPDLYHGNKTKSPNDAAKLLMELDVDRAEKEISAAGEYLLSRPECTSKSFGVVGFCMGGALAQFAASRNSNVGAAVSFYGGFKKVTVEWENLQCPILLIYGDSDREVPASQGVALGKKLRELGKDVKVVTYPGADHAFFNDSRPEVYNEEPAADAWMRTRTLFRQALI